MDIFEIRDHINNFCSYTDKENSYLSNYDEFFRPIKSSEISFLEIGIDNGGSLLLWAEYFKKGKIYGIDMKNSLPEDFYTYSQKKDLSPRIIPVLGFETPDLSIPIDIRYNKYKDLFKDIKFDVILDDGAHTYAHTKGSFDILFDHFLKPGGIYILEDWGTTYFLNWPDGSSDGTRGMGKMIKELSDEVAVVDIFKGQNKPIKGIKSKISSLVIRFGQIWIFKQK